MTTAAKSLIGKKLRPNRRVLIVEDEAHLAEMLLLNLQAAGYEASAVFNGLTALQTIQKTTPDLVLLDLMLPELTGTEIANKLRTNPATMSVPIIMLTAKSDEVDEVVGLKLGADDYITKPFSMKVLLARIEAIFRRAAEPGSMGGSAGDLLRFGPIWINSQTHEASVDDRPLKLTLTEFRLLSSLVQANGRVLSRSALMGRAMGPGVTVTERTIDVHVTAIRRKLEEHGAMVTTVRGVGYRVVCQPEYANS